MSCHVRLAALVVVGVLIAACSGGSPGAATSSTDPTTTLAPVDPARVLEVIGDADYAASVTFEERYGFNRSGSPIGVATVTGTGRYAGGDFSISTEVSIDGMSADEAEGLGIPVPGEVRVASGALYTRTDGLHWLRNAGLAYSEAESGVWIGPEPPWTEVWGSAWLDSRYPSSGTARDNTVMGHLLGALTENDVVLGEATPGDATWRFEVEQVELDPLYFGLTGWTLGLDATVVVEASPGGLPTAIEVEASWSQGLADPVDIDFFARYELADAGDDAAIVSPPTVHRLFTTTRDRFSITLPRHWQVGYYTDGGYLFTDDPFAWIEVFASSEGRILGESFRDLEDLTYTIRIRSGGAGAPYEFGAVEPFVLDGIDANRFPFTFDAGERRYQGEAVVASSDDYMVLVLWYGSTSGGDFTFDDALTTFKVLSRLEGPGIGAESVVIEMEGEEHTVPVGGGNPHRDSLAEQYLSQVGAWLEGIPAQEALELAFSACRIVDAASPEGAHRVHELRGVLAGAAGRVTASIGAGIATFCPWLLPAWDEAIAGSAGTGGALVGDAALETLRAACEDGDYLSCDVLEQAAFIDSELEAFGDTCGGRRAPAGGLCGTRHGLQVDLDALEAECLEGDFVSCDVLFLYSPIGSAQEEIGATCGGRGRQFYSCAVEHGVTP